MPLIWHAMLLTVAQPTAMAMSFCSSYLSGRAKIIQRNCVPYC